VVTEAKQLSEYSTHLVQYLCVLLLQMVCVAQLSPNREAEDCQR